MRYVPQLFTVGENKIAHGPHSGFQWLDGKWESCSRLVIQRLFTVVMDRFLPEKGNRTINVSLISSQHQFPFEQNGQSIYLLSTLS